MIETPTRTPALPPLPPGVTIPDTVLELQVEWGDGEFHLVGFATRKRRWMGKVREEVGRAQLEGMVIPPVGGTATGVATFYGPMEPWDDAEIQRPSGETIAARWDDPIKTPRIYKGDKLIFKVVFYRTV